MNIDLFLEYVKIKIPYTLKILYPSLMLKEFRIIAGKLLY